MNEYQRQVYEGIDIDVHRLCLHAEKRIRKGKLGNFMWSPKLDKAHRILQHWKDRLKIYKKIHKTGIIILQADELDIEDSIMYHRDEIEKNQGSTLCIT